MWSIASPLLIMTTTQRNTKQKHTKKTNKTRRDQQIKAMLPITSSSQSSVEPRRHAAFERSRLVAAVIVGFCVLSVVDNFRTLEPYSGRRSLLSNAYLAAQSTLLPWAHYYLVDVTDRPNPEAETALFWHM